MTGNLWVRERVILSLTLPPNPGFRQPEERSQGSGQAPLTWLSVAFRQPPLTWQGSRGGDSRWALCSLFVYITLIPNTPLRAGSLLAAEETDAEPGCSRISLRKGHIHSRAQFISKNSIIPHSAKTCCALESPVPGGTSLGEESGQDTPHAQAHTQAHTHSLARRHILVTQGHHLHPGFLVRVRVTRGSGQFPQDPFLGAK